MSFARFDTQPLWEDYGIPLAVMGIFVVFAALILLSLFISALPRIMALLHNYFPEEEPALAHAAPARAAVPEELPDETLIVIAAVVADIVREPHRIVRTRELTREEHSWSLEGRIQHHTSHQIQHRNPR